MKNKDNGIVLFNGKNELPLWLKPYKLDNEELIVNHFKGVDSEI